MTLVMPLSPTITENVVLLPYTTLQRPCELHTMLPSRLGHDPALGFQTKRNNLVFTRIELVHER